MFKLEKTTHQETIKVKHELYTLTLSLIEATELKNKLCEILQPKNPEIDAINKWADDLRKGPSGEAGIKTPMFEPTYPDLV